MEKEKERGGEGQGALPLGPRQGEAPPAPAARPPDVPAPAKRATDWGGQRGGRAGGRWPSQWSQKSQWSQRGVGGGAVWDSWDCWDHWDCWDGALPVAPQGRSVLRFPFSVLPFVSFVSFVISVFLFSVFLRVSSVFSVISLGCAKKRGPGVGPRLLAWGGGHCAASA